MNQYRNHVTIDLELGLHNLHITMKLHDYTISIIKLLFKYNILIVNFILSECLVDDRYVYPLLVNFFYK